MPSHALPHPSTPYHAHLTLQLPELRLRQRHRRKCYEAFDAWAAQSQAADALAEAQSSAVAAVARVRSSLAFRRWAAYGRAREAGERPRSLPIASRPMPRVHR